MTKSSSPSGERLLLTHTSRGRLRDLHASRLTAIVGRDFLQAHGWRVDHMAARVGDDVSSSAHDDCDDSVWCLRWGLKNLHV